MKKFVFMMLLVAALFSVRVTTASAVVNDTVKVGLRYGESSMFSANLENHIGRGYAFGYFGDDRSFVPLAETDEIAISMTAAGTIYMDNAGVYSPDDGNTVLGPWRIQVEGFSSFEEAAEAALELGGWPAWIDEMYVVRIGCYDSAAAAEEALLGYMPQEEATAEDVSADGVDAAEDPAEPEATLFAVDLPEAAVLNIVECSPTGIVVTKTKTDKILFEYDCWGVLPFGVMPDGEGEPAVTWFKGYRYYGGFEYARITGGTLNVCNLVDLEDYVKGVVPHEMSFKWPLEALKAQAVCARSYVKASSKHLDHGFDVCNTNDCQVYYGLNGSAATTDQAVEETAGECLYYDEMLAGQAVYHSSNGGATENVENVWGGKIPYLVGKEDPYEALISIPGYNWSVNYTAQELTWILEQKGYSVGTVKNVYVSEYTTLGNVSKLTIVGSKGTKTVSGNTCSTLFYSSTYNKSVKSMRFGINGSGPLYSDRIYVNGDSDKVASLNGVSVISGDGEVLKLDGGAVSVLTASGVSEIGGGYMSSQTAKADGVFLIEGVGSGHNVGMSQYGAKAMAENGYNYLDILTFYYTGIEVY